ncbi:Spy0128 family protein [Streptococcus canis]|uniref:Spy0128 family protein n=1 Tax=Streptococcus canis TaxID=1329 RepID=UPI00155F04EA|nr:FctA domain-containing protein [Streptococcus canis]QKG73163.1 LPXTG cell wall anchor domain-containing protein [Streptococcus canis]
MRKYWKSLFSVVTMLLLLCFSTPALAKDSTAETSISIENIVEKSNDKTPFSIVLESADSMKTVEEITVMGSGKGIFSPLTFTTVGQYVYRVYQKTSQNKDYQEDDTVFDVIVYVTYDEEGTLVVREVSRKSGDKEKSDIIFKPKFLTKPTLPKQPSVPKKTLPLTSEEKSLLSIVGVVLLVALFVFYVRKKSNLNRD